MYKYICDVRNCYKKCMFLIIYESVLFLFFLISVLVLICNFLLVLYVMWFYGVMCDMCFKEL